MRVLSHIAIPQLSHSAFPPAVCGSSNHSTSLLALGIARDF